MSLKSLMIMKTDLEKMSGSSPKSQLSTNKIFYLNARINSGC